MCENRGQVTVHSLQNGILDKIEVCDDVVKNNIVENHILVKPGNAVKAFIGANTTLGILIMKFNSMEQMLHMMDCSEEWIKVKTK